MKPAPSLREEIALPTGDWGARPTWPWRPLASLTPGRVADILRRAAAGDHLDFVRAAADVEEKDLHYRAVLQTRRLAVCGLPLDVQPGEDSRAGRKAAALTRDTLAALELSGVADHLLGALAVGYAVAEIIWDTTNGAWLPARVVPRPPEWFGFDRKTGRELRLLDGSREGKALPAAKFVCHTPRISAGVPLLGGLARSALWAWVFKSYALRDWARFAEVYGQPIRLGRYHEGASPDDVETLKRAVFDIGSDAAAVIPREMAIELIEAGGRAASADLYRDLIEYLDRQVSKAVLGQTLTTDQGATGSLAQAKVHDEVRRDLIHADARALAATLMRDLVVPLVRFNLGDAPLPKLRLIVEEPEDTAALAGQIQTLVAIGMPVPQAWVRERFGIPEPAPGEAVLGAPAAGAQPSDAAPQARQARFLCDAPAAHATVAEPVDAVLADRLDEEAGPAWAAIVAQVRNIVDAAESLDDLRDMLLTAFATLPVERLARVMEVGFAAAELAGRVAARDDGG